MKRIFILSPHPIFSQGVETLLNRDATLEFIGRETNPDRAIEQIKELKPDIVILDSNYVTCDSDPVLIQILQSHLGLKVIGLNLQNNRICIYHEEQRIISNVDDLRQAIRGNPSKPELAMGAPNQDQKGGI